MAINPMDAQGGGITQVMPQGMPQAGGQQDLRRPQGTVSKDLLDALVAAKLLKEKQMAQNELMLSMENDPQTVVAKNESELSQRSLDEVTKGVSGVLTKKNADMQKNMKRVASRGIANNPRQNMRRMAQGGIIGFAEGQTVDAQIAAIRNSTTMSEEQKSAAIEQLYATEAQEQAEGLKATRNFLNQNLNPDMLAGDAIGLGEKLVGGGANLLASGANLANMPGIGAALSRFGDKRSKVGQKYIDQGFYGGITNAGFDAPNEVMAAPVTTTSEGPTFEQTGRGTPPEVTPPVAAKPAVSDYEQRRTDASRALSIGGIGAFGQNIEAIEGNRAEREIKARANELQAIYNQEILSSRDTNNARSQLLQFNTQLQNLIAADPKVRAAQAKLDAAATKGKAKAIALAQAELNAARKAANAEIGKTSTGANLIAEIEAIKNALGQFRANSGSTGNDGYTIKPKG